MKKTCLSILAASVALLFTSCDKRPDITGVWVATPVSISDLSPAIDAHATYTYEFKCDSLSPKNDSGLLTVSALINANQAVANDRPNIIAPYETSVSATATVNGNWTFAHDEDDEIVISFDSQSLNVDVDPEGVTFAQNLVSDSQQPVTDSLTIATVAAWKQAITKALRDHLLNISEISDIEIHNGNIMSCEIQGRDCSLRKVQ